MVIFWRHQGNAVAEPDLPGALGAGGEEHLRRRGVRILLKEMVLDLPNIVDAEPVGELDLVEGLLVKPQFGVLGPRLGQLMLVEKSEFHPRFPSCVVPSPASLRSAPSPAMRELGDQPARGGV